MIAKQTDNRLLAVALTSGAALFALYFVFLTYLLPTIATLTNPIEIVILYTLALRAILLAGVRRFRRIPGQIKIAILALESFVLIIIIVLYIFTGDPGYNMLMGLVLTSWMAAGMIVITPYSIFEFSISMYKSSSIANILAMVAGEFATVVFLSNIAFQLTPAPSTLQELGTDLLTATRIEPGVGVTGFASTNSIIDTIAVILYFCMILYIVLKHKVEGRNYALPFILMALGTLLLFAWSSFAVATSMNVFLALSAPGAGIPLIFLVVLRGKK